jgi:two-component sensor histidine kinase
MAASVLSLQARSQSNPEVKRALDTAVGRLLSLSKAHERLNPVMDGEAGIVRMQDYLATLCRALKESIEHPTPVSLSVEGDDLHLPVSKAIPVGLIVNELVTNAFKHAFKGKEEGVLHVELRRADSLALLVEDDGVGCPEGAASGVGSQLVQLLVRQLNGTLERQKAGQGCRIRVSFPEIA